MMLLGWDKKGAGLKICFFGFKFRRLGKLSCLDVFGYSVFKKMGGRLMLFGAKVGCWNDK